MTEEQNKNGEEKVTLIITILGAIFFGFLLPLIVWFVKRDSFSSYADTADDIYSRDYMRSFVICRYRVHSSAAGSYCEYCCSCYGCCCR